VRRIEQIQNPEPIRRTRNRDERLSSWLSTGLDDDLSGRKDWELMCQECLRQYAAVPKNPVRRLPFDGAPNIEVPIGAIGVDSVAAQMTDTIWGNSRTFTVLGSKDWEKHAKAFQTFVNKLTMQKSVGLRAAYDNQVMDKVQLGTGCYYTPWTEATRTTGSHQIIQRGPRVYSIDPDNLIVPPGATDNIEELPRVTLRFLWTQGDYDLRKRTRKWKEDAEPMKSGMVSMVRQARERLAQTREPGDGPAPDKYQIGEVYCYFDYMGMGMEQTLLATYDFTSRRVLDVQYQPYDQRPITVSRYQPRPHMFMGLGPMEMQAALQNTVTEWHNFAEANAKLANARVWASRRGATADKIKITPFKTIQLNNPKEDLIPLVMADIYPSVLQYISADIMLAERRIGVNEMSMGQARGNLGSRTPAATAGALLKQFNRRFVLAYEADRAALADAMRQCILRYQERVKNGDDPEPDIRAMIGQQDAQLVMEVLRQPAEEIWNSVTLEVTASSESLNRETMRQNVILATNIMTQYYEKTVQLLGALGLPPEQMKAIGMKVFEHSTEWMDRFLRTFDEVRDPSIFLLSPEEVNSGQQAAMGGGAAGGLEGLGQLLGALGGNAGGPPTPNGTPPNGPVPGGGAQPAGRQA
jgi:hypothetical protein